MNGFNAYTIGGLCSVILHFSLLRLISDWERSDDQPSPPNQTNSASAITVTLQDTRARMAIASNQQAKSLEKDLNGSKKLKATQAAFESDAEKKLMKGPSNPISFATAPDDVVGEGSGELPTSDKAEAVQFQTSADSVPRNEGSVSHENDSKRGIKELVREGIVAPRLRVQYEPSELMSLLKAGKAALVVEKKRGPLDFRLIYSRETDGKFVFMPPELQARYDNRGIDIPAQTFADLAASAAKELGGESPASLTLHLDQDLAKRAYNCQLDIVRKYGIDQKDQPRVWTVIRLRWDGKVAHLEPIGMSNK